MEFDSFIDQAWSAHADDPAGTAARIQAEAAALVGAEPQIVALAHLAHHVWGAHLGRWTEGVAYLHSLSTLPVWDAQAPGATAVARFAASLQLAGGLADPRPAQGVSDRIRIGALAAASLGAHHPARAGQLLQEALADVQAGPLPADDPARRALAVAGNNLAAELEEKPQLDEAERALMVQAAQVGRRFWEQAGTWLEVERAEYRLARTWLKAGDAQQAQQHAQACLDLVQAQQAPALEAFFAWEALALCARAQADDDAHAQALQHAAHAFAALAPDDQAWCRATLDQLQGSRPAAA